MDNILVSPASASVCGIPTIIFSLLIPFVGVALFLFIMYRRLNPLFRASADPRLNHFFLRLLNMVKYAIFQYRQPRYRLAGILHIVIFAGFVILSMRSLNLVVMGFSEGFSLPGLGGETGRVYGVLKDCAGTLVLIACLIAMVRRGLFTPQRYLVPERYGKKGHMGEALFVLMLISGLMACDMFFDGTQAAAGLQKGVMAKTLIPGTGSWIVARLLSGTEIACLQNIHLLAYYLHDFIFFFFLCFLPFGKHFHVITSLPNVFFMKLNKGSVKPVRWGVADDALDSLESFGVKNFEDFTWKHMLDFYSCADCGRCSDNCPANAVGRPLSPRFISIKCRDYAYRKYPVFGNGTDSGPMVGNVLKEDEIWSCTTCGACEEECPLLIEYIDKIVDLRRGMVDEGMVPQSLQKALMALQKRGNPYAKMERKRAEWTKREGFSETCPVNILGKKGHTDTLYFVDSITSYDDRIQDIARATARVLSASGIDVGILGPAEKDSGHEVRRFGEEMLFQELKDTNTDAILRTGAEKIVTNDPHTFNALKKDYADIPPVEHISQFIAKNIASGKIRLKHVEDDSAIYTYHDPCYLGRHNGIYDVPRQVIDAIPGIRRVEMKKCRDRSFCCGGGGLMLFYEPVEDTRMGKLRVEMAKDAGATVIVTACPFCMVNIEDAIKTTGLEGKMQAIDLVELIDRHLLTDS